jgi:hypothetical protein
MRLFCCGLILFSSVEKAIRYESGGSAGRFALRLAIRRNTRVVAA